MDIDKMLKKIKEEVENVAIGHEVINKTSDAKLFNRSTLENVVIDCDGFNEYSGEVHKPEHSTFDEANYTLGYDENS